MTRSSEELDAAAQPDLPFEQQSELGEESAGRPFLKWAGGKQALWAELCRRFPVRYGRYYEPFLGGGSVFFNAAPVSATLGDANAWLIETYEAVRSDWRAVAQILDGLANTREDYLRIRARDPADEEPATRAAHFIYLNKLGFRGLFRVNRCGRFNVPYGAYDRRTYDPAVLEAAARTLQGAELRVGDFEETLAGVSAGDFVYFDPPYFKLGGYSDFNRYTGDQFRNQDHERLAEMCHRLTREGVTWVLSQSDTPEVRRWFEGFPMETITARREINLKITRRSVKELIVWSSVGASHGTGAWQTAPAGAPPRL